MKQSLSLTALAVLLLASPAAAATCSSSPQKCPTGEQSFYAPTGSSICESGGFYCKKNAANSVQSIANSQKKDSGARSAPQSAALSLGSKGTAVTTLQNQLVSLGYLASDSATGYFGKFTQAAVVQFQRDNGLEAVGYVGPKTAKLLTANSSQKAAGTAEHTLTADSSQPTATQPASINTLPALLAQIKALQDKIAALKAGTATTLTMAVTSGGGGGGVSNPPPVTSTQPPTCTPLPTETRTQSCPAGQTGSITETRTSSCTSGVAGPVWGGWGMMANTCVFNLQGPISNLKDPGIHKNLWGFLQPGTAKVDSACNNSSAPLWNLNSVSVDGSPCAQNGPSGQLWTQNTDGSFTVRLSLNNTLNSQRYSATRSYFGIQSTWPAGSKNLLYVPELKKLSATVHIKIDSLTSACDDAANSDCVQHKSPIPDWNGKVYPWTTVVVGLPMYDETNKRNLWIEVAPYWTKEAIYGAQSYDADGANYLFHGESSTEELHRIKISHFLIAQQSIAAGQEATYTIDFLKLIQGLTFGHEHQIDWNHVHLGDVYVGTESWGWTLTNFDVSDIDLTYQKK